MFTRVNIGCGRTLTPGWRNFDNSMSLRLARHPRLVRILHARGLLGSNQIEFIEFCRTHEILWVDACRSIPLADGSVQALYSSHMFEHLDPVDAGGFLAEARRVLALGGVLRLAVPDLRKLCETYLSSGDADAFMKATYLATPRPRSWRERLAWNLIGARHHQWMYDGPSLSSLLSSSGFTDCAMLAPGLTTIADLGELNLAERADETVYVRRGDASPSFSQLAFDPDIYSVLLVACRARHLDIASALAVSARLREPCADVASGSPDPCLPD